MDDKYLVIEEAKKDPNAGVTFYQRKGHNYSLIKKMPIARIVRSLQLSPCGRYVAVSTIINVFVMERETGRTIIELDSKEAIPFALLGFGLVAFSQDGKFLAVNYDTDEQNFTKVYELDWSMPGK